MSPKTVAPEALEVKPGWSQLSERQRKMRTVLGEGMGDSERGRQRGRWVRGLESVPVTGMFFKFDKVRHD